MDNKKVTIKTVAQAANVSISTVSQILNGNANRFNPKTVKKVLDIKNKLHYKPDYFAQRMIVKKDKTIGVLIPDISNPFFTTLIRGVENVLYQKGFMTIFCSADYSIKKEDFYLSELIRRGIDGFIISNSAISDSSINNFLRPQNYPFVVLDQKRTQGFGDAVLTNDFRGGQLAAAHLHSLGHQNIAVLMPKNATTNIKNRLKGFKSIYSEKDITIIDTALTKTGGYNAVYNVINTDVTAIFAVSDAIAFGVYYGLKQYGKLIPQDYSVVGYDNVDMCTYVFPELTTIAQPTFEIGQQAANLILDRLVNPHKDWEVKCLDVSLKIRNSTAQLH